MGAAKRTNNVNGYGEKLAVRIITVDKAKNRVECATPDGAMIWAAVWETPTVFRWPTVGETWTVRKDTNVWRLDQIVQNELTEEISEAVPKTLEELPEGDARIIGNVVHTNDLNAGNVEAGGQITASDQSLVNHTDLTPNGSITPYYTVVGDELVSGQNVAAVSLDNVVPQVGQRILVKEEPAPVNGIYSVKQWDVNQYLFSASPENFADQPISSTLKASEGAYANFQQLAGTETRGTEKSSSWSPSPYPTVSGLQWKTPINPGKYGIVSQITINTNTFSEAGRYVSIWTALQNTTERTGVRGLLMLSATNTYNVYLQRITNNVLSSEINTVGFVVGAPLTLQVFQRYDGYWLSVNNTAILYLNDQTWVGNECFTGIEGSGSNPSLVNFRTGQAPSTGAIPYKATWRLKKSEDEIKTGQQITVEQGATKGKGTNYSVKSATSTETAFEEWHPVTFLGTWANFEAGWAGAAYRKTPDGIVYIRGLIKAGAFGVPSPIFVLPSGYRPAGNIMWVNHIVYNNGTSVVTGIARIDALSTGTVQLEALSGASITYLSITGSFYADGN